MKILVKLPKEMQEKAKSKPRRPQPAAKRDSTQLGSRQMRRKMQQQGIEMDQIEEGIPFEGGMFEDDYSDCSDYNEEELS